MPDRTGQQLGNYRLLELLGTGGFAEVYLGEHVYLNTNAAVKVLQTQLSDSDNESFQNEARTIAHLSHPHIVRVMDFGVDNKTPFLVMDFARHGTLRNQHPKGSRLPLPTVVSHVKQVASALQYAHNAKLVHRDIKPENMLLDQNNKILLSDFGIALAAQSSRYQSTQDVIGTVAYMSPEQIQGKPRPASDQYSLAIVVYEWLSGDRPFHGSFTELCTQHMFASPPSLHEKLSTLSPGVEQVVNIALSKDPKQRFGSIQAFANALEHASLQAQKETSSASHSIQQPSTQGSLSPTILPDVPPRIAPTLQVTPQPIVVTEPEPVQPLDMPSPTPRLDPTKVAQQQPVATTRPVQPSTIPPSAPRSTKPMSPQPSQVRTTQSTGSLAVTPYAQVLLDTPPPLDVMNRLIQEVGRQVQQRKQGGKEENTR